jgi:tubulin--tyrosine ligase
LTNDAVQKYSADYGKFESSNKLSYADLEKILSRDKGVSFKNVILPKIKQYVTDVFEAVGARLYLPSIGKPDFVPKIYNGFELMGFDFMLDDNLNLTLIEVNTNPCLDTPCLLL